MKKLCLILPFLCSQVYALTDIEPNLANQMFNEKKAVIVDVREPNEVSQGSIKYSIKIPLSLMENNPKEFEQLIERLPKDKEVYVYCRSGRRSKIVGDELEKRKFKVKNLGAFDKWKGLWPSNGVVMDLNLHWNDGMKFTSEIRGHQTNIDAAMSVGGTNTAPTPKELVLTGIAGCSAMDAIAYLRKKKMLPLDFNIKSFAELTSTTPKYFSKVHLIYKFLGDNLDQKVVIQSVETSMTKYCGVSLMISKSCPITYDIELNSEVIFSGKANFNI